MYAEHVRETFIQRYGPEIGTLKFEEWSEAQKNKNNSAFVEAGITPRQMKYTWDQYQISNEKQKRYVKMISEYGGTRWLCLLGNTGTGKTHLAACLVKDRIASGKSAVIINVKRLIDELMAADFKDKVKIIDRMSSVDLLVLNEIGRSVDTKYFKDTIFEIIDRRYEGFKQTVFISNLKPEVLFSEYFDEANARRISEMGEVLTFDWFGRG